MNRKAEVVLYTKPGCSLCEEMKADMKQARCDDLYTFKEVDIETDAALLAAYRYEIPVLMIDGVEAFSHRLTSKAFRAKLVESLR